MSRKYKLYCSSERGNKFVISGSEPTACPSSGSHNIVANSVSIYEQYIQDINLFGDGSDGDVTISSNTTLSRDMYYRNLTIDSGAIVAPGGYRIFISSTLTITNGWISNNGGPGTDVTHSASNVLAITGFGTAGGDATTGAGGSAGNLGAGLRLGGLGGAGGAGSGFAAGSAGTGTVLQTTNGGTAVFKSPLIAITGRGLANSILYGGTGGGAGGASAAGSRGGGGGGGGGPVIVAARFITVTVGGIRANGGDGEAGTASGSGGGGGGGGGYVVVITASDISTATITASGGAGGIATGAGTAGSAGSAGTVYRIIV